MLLKGVVIIIAVWAGLVAWTAKTAQARGRSVIVWPLAAAALGGLVFAAGVQVFTTIGVETDLGFIVALLPVVLMIAVMGGVVWILQRQPIHVARRNHVRVHFMDRGEGTVSFRDDTATFAWADGSREARLHDVSAADADGECVRVRFTDASELCILPLGKPETPAGRREQSVQLARQLCPSYSATLPRAFLLPARTDATAGSSSASRTPR